MQQSTPYLALQIIERELKEKTGKLVLSDCGITEIPREVFKMDWLTELIITNGYGPPKTYQSTSEAPEPNHLTYIPEEIAQLKNLKKLHLGPSGTSPWTISDIGVLAALTVLEELNLNHNQISDISTLQNLVHLKSLHLSLNQINDIMPLAKLVGLEKLQLFNNRIEDIYALMELTELKELGLDGNQVFDISFLHRLTKLNKLLLNGNKIGIIEPLESLTLLQELHLNSTGISNINALQKMTRLRVLDISFNRIQDLGPLQNITGLQDLFFSSNQVTNLAPLEKMAVLQKLHCFNNQIEDLSPLVNLNSLSELFINGNNIKAIEPLIQLPKLKTLGLNNNPVSDCPPDVWETNDIKQIRAHFAGQNRDAVFRQEQQAHQEQLQQLVKEQEKLKQKLEQQTKLPEQKQEKETIRKRLVKTEKELEKTKQKTQALEESEINDVKLIFVGNSGAGKTQLSKYFESGKLNDQRESTHGIRLKRWLPNSKVSPALAGLKDKIAANIWDFGGQEYYHGTFRLFLSNYAVYVLLWEKETNRNDTLPTLVHKDVEEELQHYHYKYWLDNIRHFAPTSPVIILQNKVDKDQRERVDTEWIKEYEIFGDHYISLHEAANGKLQQYKWSFDLFCNDLSACMQSILAEEINQQKSIAWLRVRDAVVGATKETPKNDDNPFIPFLQQGKYIHLVDFEKACLVIEPRLTESELYTLPRWLHNSGLVIYFSEDQQLSDKVYLDPAWVTEGIYRILNETVRAKDGLFTKGDMKTHKGFQKETVLALMSEMEIIFEKTDKPGTFVAPQYLPETHAVEDLYAIAAKGLQQKAFFIRLPLYFFRKVLQRMIFFYGMSKGVDARYYWKKGILFEKRGTRVMFKGILPKAEDDHGVFLIGAEPVGDYMEIQKEVFHIISAILEEQELAKIAKPSEAVGTSKVFYSRPANWTDLYDNESVKAPRWLKNLEVSVDGQNFVRYLELCKENRNKMVFIQSDRGERLRIHDFEVLLDSKPQQPLKVFFSYSHKDTEIMNRLSVHLAPLRRLNKIEVWTDKAIQAGEEWDAEIEKNLRSSNIILLLVSADFVASSYIWEKEIPMVLKLEKEKNARVIPIYLRPFDFSSLQFSKNQMIPKDPLGQELKAISQWENMDEAFMEVAKKIREVIESFN